MNILVACDSFKDALPADAVCRAIAKGLRHNYPDLEIVEMPLSDGGEGLLDVLAPALKLFFIEDMVADATLPEPVRGRVELLRRNSLRLLKLVNSLLEFSRRGVPLALIAMAAAVVVGMLT